MDGQRMREGFRDNESRKPFSPCRWAAFLPYLILFPKSVSKQVLMSYPHSPVPSELGANLKISIVLAKKVLRRVPKRISQMVFADGLIEGFDIWFHSGFRRRT